MRNYEKRITALVISFSMLLVLVISLMPSTLSNAEEKKIISSVDLTFNPPSVGTEVHVADTLQYPLPSVTSSTEGLRDSTNVEGSYLKTADDRSSANKFYGTFEEGKTYYASILLSLDYDGEYRFSDNVNFNVNGATFITSYPIYPDVERFKGRCIRVVVSFTPKSGSEPRTIPEGPEGTMYRLYNSNSGEHFYTRDINEANNLYNIGWDYETYAWTSPTSSEVPVYRLYNSFGGYHHYTTSVTERDNLVSLGWADEGIAWYSYDDTGVPLYRVYNPNAKGEQEAGGHHYTKDVSERNYLISIGWIDEGIGWYGV